MESVSDFANRRWVLPVVSLLVGVAIGTFYAWVINPVQWVDGTPEQLRADLQEDYLRMAIDSYSVNRDADLAIVRFTGLGENGSLTLTVVAEDPQEVSPTSIQGFRAVTEIEGASTEPVEETGNFVAQAARLIPYFCGLTVAIGLVLAVVLVLRARGRVEDEGIAVAAAPSGEYEAPIPEQVEVPHQPEQALQLEPEAAVDDSLATFRTIYALGDDDYDDSFSIESPTGDFLGECGVGIGDLIGAGEPNKVSAFEVWLFDKNDIQTVTKVLLSNYSYQDTETRGRLSAKGDPIVAEPGSVISLQTASLEVEARVVDMTYGESALPSESFFERLTIELRAWSREAAG